MADAGTRTQHWATQKERGSFALMKLTALAVRYLGRRPLTPVLYLIVLYFFVFGRQARRNVRQYKDYLSRWRAAPNFGHACVRSSASSWLSRTACWTGSMSGVASYDSSRCSCTIRLACANNCYSASMVAVDRSWSELTWAIWMSAVRWPNWVSRYR